MPVNNIDLARIYGAGEAIKGARSQNALNDMTLKNTQAFNSLAPRIAAGDKEATIEGAGVNPQGTAQIMGIISKMDESQRAIARQNVEEVAKLLLTVEKSPAEQRPAAWQRARQQAQAWGLDVNDVPEQYDPQYARFATARLMEMDKLLGTDMKAPKVETFYDNKGQAYKAQWNQETNSWQPVGGSKAEGGTSLKVNPDGTIEFTQGGARINPGAELSKPTQNKVEEKALTSSEGLARLNSIQKSFRPEFMEIGTRFNQAWNAKLEKLGQPLSPEDQKSLTEYTTFSRNALSNLNDYIKEITGAALSEMEAKRIMAAAPNPGQGIFDGDSPTQFKAKMDAAINELTLANARSIYAAKVGINALDVSLTSMRDVVNKRYNAEYESLKAAGLEDGAAKAKARELVKTEFGI